MRTNRRRVLRAIGVGTIGGVAGCKGNGSTTDTGSPTESPAETPTAAPAETPTATSTATPSKEVSGRILTPDEQPLDRGLVGFATPEISDTTWYGTLTDSDGRFTLELPQERLFVGAYQLTDENAGSSTFDLTSDGMQFPRDGVSDVAFVADVGPDEMDVGTATLSAGHLLTITVVNANGDPVSEALVDVLHSPPAVPDDKEGMGVVNVGTDADGRFVFEFKESETGIEVSGPVTIRARPPGDRTLGSDRQVENHVEVTEDSSVRVQLDDTES